MPLPGRIPGAPGGGGTPDPNPDPDTDDDEYTGGNDPRRDPDNWDGTPDDEPDPNPGSDWDDPEVDPPNHGGNGNTGDDSIPMYEGNPRSDYTYTGDETQDFQKWVSGDISTSFFQTITSRGNGTAKLVLGNSSPDPEPGLGHGEDDPRRDPDNWDGTPDDEPDPNPGSDWGDPDVDPPATQDPDWWPGTNPPDWWHLPGVDTGTPLPFHVPMGLLGIALGLFAIAVGLIFND